MVKKCIMSLLFLVSTLAVAETLSIRMADGVLMLESGPCKYADVVSEFPPIMQKYVFAGKAVQGDVETIICWAVTEDQSTLYLFNGKGGVKEIMTRDLHSDKPGN